MAAHSTVCVLRLAASGPLITFLLAPASSSIGLTMRAAVQLWRQSLCHCQMLVLCMMHASRVLMVLIGLS